MCYLRASILVHAIGCKGNREDIAASTLLHQHPRRLGYEAAAAPNSAVQRCKFVVRWRNDRAEVLLHEVGIQAQSRVHVGKDNTQLLKIFTYLVVDSLTLVLGRHACQELTLGL